MCLLHDEKKKDMTINFWFGGSSRSWQPYRQSWSSRPPSTTANRSIWCTWEMWAETISWNEFARSSVWSMRRGCVWAKSWSTLPASKCSSPSDTGTVRSRCPQISHRWLHLWFRSPWNRCPTLWPPSMPIPIQNCRSAPSNSSSMLTFRLCWLWAADCSHSTRSRHSPRHQCVLYFSNFHFD